MPRAACIAPRDVFCPTGHLYRDVARAEQACCGIYTSAGETLHVGEVPDWRSVDVHHDVEWWIEWSKFYIGLDLAHAYGELCAPRFLDTWIRLVSSWIEQMPPGSGPTDAIGRRLQNWVYSWGAFARCDAFPGLAAGFENALVESLQAQAIHLEGHLTAERNHRTLELYGLLVVGVALPELDEGRAERAWLALQDNLQQDVRADGVQREHSTHYHLVALRSFLAARENARRFGLSIPPAYDERLALACEFAMHCIRPDGSIPALSDGDVADHSDTLALAGRLLDRNDFLFAGTRGHRGSPPAHAHGDFPQGGYFVQRSPWDAAAPHTSRHLIFDCGAPGDGGHGHYDLLGIDVWAGRPLLVDPGRYTYAEGDPNWRRWFKSTAAHNTVTVDGLDQMPYRCGKPRGPLAVARLLRLAHAPLFDVVGGEAQSPCYDAIHRRHVCFVAHDYWIVVDELRSETTHTYELRYHLSPEADGSTRISGDTVAAPGLTLLVHGGAIGIEPGWVSPSYGIKHAAPIVVCSVRASSALFVTAILPERSGATPGRDATMTVSRETATVIRLTQPGEELADAIALSTDGERIACGAAGDWRGQIAWERRGGDGVARSITVCADRQRPRDAGTPAADWVSWRPEGVCASEGWSR
jgi:hypothetical protein